MVFEMGHNGPGENGCTLGSCMGEGVTVNPQLLIVAEVGLMFSAPVRFEMGEDGIENVLREKS